MSVTAFPLTWPEGMPRARQKAQSQFRTALPAALKNVRGTLEAFGRDTGKTISSQSIVISSNVTLGQERPADSGVAVWFDWDEAQRCIAVDRYPKVEDNLQAIHHILEARRTEMRHGGLQIVRQTFKGFMALPAPEQWWEILGVSRSATPPEIETAYRQKAKAAHPDQGGNDADMARLNRARDEARRSHG